MRCLPVSGYAVAGGVAGILAGGILPNPLPPSLARKGPWGERVAGLVADFAAENLAGMLADIAGDVAGIVAAGWAPWGEGA